MGNSYCALMYIGNCSYRTQSFIARFFGTWQRCNDWRRQALTRWYEVRLVEPCGFSKSHSREQRRLPLRVKFCPTYQVRVRSIFFRNFHNCKTCFRFPSTQTRKNLKIVLVSTDTKSTFSAAHIHDFTTNNNNRIAGTALGCVCVLRMPVWFYRFSLATRFYLVPVLARELAVSRSIDILRLAVSSIVVFVVLRSHLSTSLAVLFLAPIVTPVS